MATLFTKIITGDIPCHKLHENNRFFAFLDIRPIAPGHTLVIPKEETDIFFDLSDEHLSEILVFAKPIATAIKTVVPCNRIGLMIAGLEVPHAHLHLVPINSIGELSFSHAKPTDNETLAQMCEAIRGVLNKE